MTTRAYAAVISRVGKAKGEQEHFRKQFSCRKQTPCGGNYTRWCHKAKVKGQLVKKQKTVRILTLWELDEVSRNAKHDGALQQSNATCSLLLKKYSFTRLTKDTLHQLTRIIYILLGRFPRYVCVCVRGKEKEKSQSCSSNKKRPL